MTLEMLPMRFAVCKLKDFTRADPALPFCFCARTEAECSWVGPEEDVPENVLQREDGWRAFRVAGQLDFSLVGILSQISGVLARARVGIFAISTFDTDYILTKEENWQTALDALREAGFALKELL